MDEQSQAEESADKMKAVNSWCDRLVGELERLQKDRIGLVCDPDKEPEWVQRVLRELMQQAMPVFRGRKPRGHFPKELGHYLGQQQANFFGVRDALLRMPVEKAKRELMRLKGQGVPGVESTLKAVEQTSALLRPYWDYLPVFEKVLKRAFSDALKQASRDEAVSFFQGFATGISKPGLSNGRLAGSTDATLVYSKLYVHRREVERLENYPALREFLVLNGVSENAAGSVRRLQKLCERVGLQLAKRGRPRKFKKLRHIL